VDNLVLYDNNIMDKFIGGDKRDLDNIYQLIKNILGKMK
jgi:hypothetical protein